ncbi:MAG: pilin [Candidatus Paceibacterota bacterium]
MRIFLFALLFFGIPLALFAQGFTPLTTDFPILSTENASFSSVLNIFLNVVIGIAAVLAVIKIAIGGFKYMGTESFSSKGEAKEDITNAVIGLIIVLAAVFILNIINPDLIKLDVFRNTESVQVETGGNAPDYENEASLGTDWCYGRLLDGPFCEETRAECEARRDAATSVYETPCEERDDPTEQLGIGWCYTETQTRTRTSSGGETIFCFQNRDACEAEAGEKTCTRQE